MRLLFIADSSAVASIFARSRTSSLAESVKAVTDGPYRDLGNLLAAMALQRLSRDPYAIAERIEEVTHHAVDPREVLDYLEGIRCPNQKFIPAFAEAFSLTAEERRRLAWVYTFSEPPD